MNIDTSKIKITLDPSVRHISKVACMLLSGSIENGILLTGRECVTVTVHKDRLDFGKCIHPDMQEVSGHLAGNFYKEYGNIVYRFGSNLKCSFFSKTIEYKGFDFLAPDRPDNSDLFHLLYPRFA